MTADEIRTMGEGMKPTDWVAVAAAAVDFHGALQRRDELAWLLLAVAVREPQVVVEIGVDRGGTLFCWRRMCERVFGISLPGSPTAAFGSGGVLVDHGAEVLFADSHAQSSVEWLVDRLDGAEVDVLFIDGDHSYVGVARDHLMYGPLVRSGGLVVFHDVRVHYPGVGVARYWSEVTSRPGARWTELVSRKHRPYGFGLLEVP